MLFRRVAFSFIVATALLASVVLLAAWFGTDTVSWSHALRNPSSVDRAVLLEVRLPRIAMAALAGAGLSVVGASFQSLLGNPLAEPYVLGVSGGAALGATVTIAFGIPIASTWASVAMPLSAMFGGITATAIVYSIAVSQAPSRGRSASSAASILLAGVIVNGIASSLITFIKTIVSASKAQNLLFWLTGYIDVPSSTTLAVTAFCVLVGSILLIADAGRLNLLSLGDESSEYLGVNVRGLTRRVFVVSSLVVGAIVSTTGLIGFVGLVVPHFLRRLVGPDHRLLLPMSLFVGASTLVLCDLVARVAFRWLGTEPPVGAVTALIGGPLFLVLLRRQRR